MHLRFNSDRLIARLAAEASRDPQGPALSQERPWRRAPVANTVPAPAPLGRSAADSGELAADDPRRHGLEAAIRAAVIGDLDSIDCVLTSDAAGWSPSAAFTSLGEAEAVLGEGTAALTVEGFHIGGLWWCEPVAIAEWHVEAALAGPLLLGDDVLVDRTGHSVAVSGATLAALRGDRIAAVHTYFDEASLIEQVLFG